jgi:hypothetical protein
MRGRRKRRAVPAGEGRLKVPAPAALYRENSGVPSCDALVRPCMLPQHDELRSDTRLPIFLASTLVPLAESLSVGVAYKDGNHSTCSSISW